MTTAIPEPDESCSDSQLIAAINRGGPAGVSAFNTLYQRYRAWVVALAYRVTGDENLALDVLQETFLYLLRQFPGLTLTAQFKTYLYPIVRHIALTQLQKCRRLAGDVAILNHLESPSTTAEPGDLQAVLSSLPEGQREVLVLRFVDGLALAEIAQALGLPVGTVKSRLHLALATLRSDARLKKYFVGE